jgi:hypothetical protein
MSRDKSNSNTIPYNLASQIRGLYGRVARQLKVDPSYVSRVARGERQSDDIEASLERELKRIMSLMKNGHNGAGRNGAGRDGAGRDGASRDGASHRHINAKTKKKTLRIGAEVR